ncbi:Major Facilitator Superfamily protein [Poriferisphaera corsica]|uniref:Major Facilitator Superfamily protein n=1 Tax=Poriferisphaera corsica TaxID=2528020 RepID=A0A517YZ48_9BACT|nr:MFS transporter [Poriferisphaera corsica]QDU35498.1 Major Facilitator Superfamily protein [Poriferisphaera corsica]
MIGSVTRAFDFRLKGLGLSREVVGRYRWQMGWAVAMAVTDGIMANAPVMALKSMAAEPWKLGVNLALSSVGMFASLWIGWLMARRRKKPFVVVPGLIYAVCVGMMTLTDQSLVFLSLLGVAMVFELMTRPAVTAIVRECYPAEVRSTLMGRIRAVTSVVFVGSVFGSAWVLDVVTKNGGDVLGAIDVLLWVGVGMVVLSLLMFWKIGVPRDGRGEREVVRDEGEGVTPWRTIGRDKRLHRYLLGCMMFGFGGLLYVSWVPKVLTGHLGMGYLMAAMFLHVLPACVQCVVVAPMGAWLDKVNVWKGWSCIRLLWGMDAVLLGVAILLPGDGGVALGLVVMARMLRGSAMGGSYVLWWQTGIHQFASPGADTSRYMSLQTAMNGVLRLVAPLVGMLMVAHGSLRWALAGGAGVIMLSVVHAMYEARREGIRPELANTASYEKSFEEKAEAVRTAG